MPPIPWDGLKKVNPNGLASLGDVRIKDVFATVIIGNSPWPSEKASIARAKINFTPWTYIFHTNDIASTKWGPGKVIWFVFFCNIFLLNRLNTYLSCGLLDYSSSVNILWSNPVGLWEVQTLFLRSKQRYDDIYYGRYRIHNVYI